MAIWIIGVYVIVVYRAFDIASVVAARLRLMIVVDVVQVGRLIGLERANFRQWHRLSHWSFLSVESSRDN